MTSRAPAVLGKEIGFVAVSFSLCPTEDHRWSQQTEQLHLVLKGLLLAFQIHSNFSKEPQPLIQTT